jgi:hypothetical protein
MAAEAPDIPEEVEFEFPVKEAPKGRRKAQTATDSTGIETEDSEDRLEHIITPVQAVPRTRRKRGPNKAYTASESAVLAPTVVNLANLAAVAWVGPEAVMQAHETALIQPSLERIFNRMPAETAKKASFIVDPLLIVVGAGMWFGRLIQLQAAKKAREKIGTVEQQAEHLRASGVAGSEFTVESQDLPTIDHGAPYVNGTPSATQGAPTGGVPDAIRDAFGETEEVISEPE